ncbi:MAG: hypothetical protein MJK05_03540 [Nitrosopumilus sp.]|nr:hypothetical protein [Nitrosopumilus sp.]
MVGRFNKIIIIALIPLVLSIGMAPAMSFGNIFGTPNKQMDDGVLNEDVLCRVGFDLVLRPSGSVACVTPTSSEKLTGLGWETLAEDSPVLAELNVVEKTIEIDGLTVSYKEGGHRTHQLFFCYMVFLHHLICLEI